MKLTHNGINIRLNNTKPDIPPAEGGRQSLTELVHYVLGEEELEILEPSLIYSDGTKVTIEGGGMYVGAYVLVTKNLQPSGAGFAEIKAGIWKIIASDETSTTAQLKYDLDHSPLAVPYEDDWRVFMPMPKLFGIYDQLAKATYKKVFTNGESISVADNTIYTASEDIYDLEILGATGSSVVSFDTAASGTITITLPQSIKFTETPTFGNSEHWEIAVRNGYAVFTKYTLS
ncbi:MAG: hypothetical protein IJP79_07205 [Paludibacteraceae bacterium]|nr:hypothetical protein [Paludibacteraceae bacterium]MBQ6963471.1 hypothetical protein [Paludibacteraceae bacterium]MBQ7662515.1 hypothetical protein [Prevotella sp.]MBQ7748260.1 hypothetical protein [Paludibacteraceae bacterium]